MTGADPEARLDQPLRPLGKRAAGRDRHVYVAGALALTEPGPAAAGLVVTDPRGRLLARRAHYVGHTTRFEAAARALLTAARLAFAGGLEAPVFRIDDPTLADALSGARAGETWRGKHAPLLAAIQDALSQLPGYRVEVVPSSTNQARAVALTPLADWLPERTRRAERLQVTPLGGHRYAVASESTPGQVYHVTLRPPGAGGEGDPVQCECADFVYRGIPCKHLLAVAREAGAPERLFYPQPA